MEQRCEIKEKAIALRKKGKSIVEIERLFKINRSTLSYWFRGIKLSEKHNERLEGNKLNALVEARKLASIVNKQKKEKRIQEAENLALASFQGVCFKKDAIKEMCLAMLYLGEGFKKNKEFGLGNSNPAIVKLFLSLAIEVYKIPREKFIGELHLRADQNPEEMIKFWSKELKISGARFRVYIDNRTVGRKTYSGYYGVCSLRGGPIHYQRRVIHFGDLIIKKVLENGLRD